jgi:hypothetical protein
MSTKHYGPKYEKESKKQRKLRQEVLGHLKAYGPGMGTHSIFTSFRTALRT